MPSFTVEQLRQLMDKTDDIRSMSIIAHEGHGKSSLTSCLTGKAGVANATASTGTAVPLCFEHDAEDGKGPQPHLINMIDSPGSEVTAALRITDGALVVVDCVEGVSVQTETVLRQALQERVVPCLFVNKLDRCILELHMEAEDIYRACARAIESANVVISTYNDPKMGDLQVFPERGTVAFGSGIHGWGFDLNKFAKMYSAKFGVDHDKMVERLWGDSYFNAKKKKWTSQSEDGGDRTFCQFIIHPVSQLMNSIMNNEKDKYERMMGALRIDLKDEDKALSGKDLMQRVMSSWLDAAEALLKMIVTKLPSPRKAQQYRVENLYEGPMDDAAARAIRGCDPKGPLMMYVSRMCPNPKGGFYAFGRVFSGTIAKGQKVRIQGPDYKPGSKGLDLHVKDIEDTVLMLDKAEAIQDVPCGNTVALVGVDQYILKAGTITTLEDAHNFACMKYSVCAVVKVAVKPSTASDLPKLVEGLKKLSKSDPLAVCTSEESGEHAVAGSGDLHVDLCVKELKKYAQCDLIVSEPRVSYCETVSAPSEPCSTVSPNTHNRIHVKAEPLAEELSKALEGAPADLAERAKLLVGFGWEKQLAETKIWAYGPETANILVDATADVQYLGEVKEHVTMGFQWATKEGPLCEENMRGIRFSLMDATLHADAIQRGAAQIMTPTRRCCCAAELMAKPALQEPVFLVSITCPQPAMGGVYSCLNSRRGKVLEEIPREGTPLMKVTALLPVSESFGFHAALRGETGGQASPSCALDHWENLEGNPLDKGSKAGELILSIRKRKNIKAEMPDINEYLDK